MSSSLQRDVIICYLQSVATCSFGRQDRGESATCVCANGELFLAGPSNYAL